jgi:hypothetical protein
MGMNVTLRLLVLVLIAAHFGASARAQAGHSVSVDDSLTPEAYRKQGLPPLDRPWTIKDYVAANRVLGKLDYKQLPRSTSPRSVAVIDRMADPGNLILFASKSIPEKSRLQSLLDFFDAVRAIERIYIAAQTHDSVLREDALRIFGLMLKMTVVEIDLVDKVTKTFKEGDPSYRTKLSALEQLKLGLTQIALGSLDMLEDCSKCRSSIKVSFATILADSMPTIAPKLPSYALTEFREKATRLANLQDDAAIKAALAKNATFDE